MYGWEGLLPAAKDDAEESAAEKDYGRGLGNGGDLVGRVGGVYGVPGSGGGGEGRESVSVEVIAHPVRGAVGVGAIWDTGGSAGLEGVAIEIGGEVGCVDEVRCTTI